MTTSDQNGEKPKIKLFDPSDPGIDPLADTTLEQVYQEFNAHNIEQRKAGEKVDETVSFKCRQITPAYLSVLITRQGSSIPIALTSYFVCHPRC